MKKIILILVAASIIYACKKKKDPEPEPEAAPIVHKISVKINGAEKSCDNSCFSSSSSGGLKGSYFYLAGVDESIYLGYAKAPSVGSHSLAKYGEPNLVYFLNNAQFHAVSGTLNVSSVDTSTNGAIKQLVGTFEFKTDTSFSGGKFYIITEGSINIKL